MSQVWRFNWHLEKEAMASDLQVILVAVTSPLSSLPVAPGSLMAFLEILPMFSWWTCSPLSDGGRCRTELTTMGGHSGLHLKGGYLLSSQPLLFLLFPPIFSPLSLLAPKTPSFFPLLSHKDSFQWAQIFTKKKKMTLVFGNFCFSMGKAGYWPIYNLNWGQWKDRKHKHQWKYFNHLPWHTYKALATQKCRSSPFLL